MPQSNLLELALRFIYTSDICCAKTHATATMTGLTLASFGNQDWFNARTRENRQTAHWHGPPALLWLSSYIASHHLAVVLQFGSKDTFQQTIYYVTLKSNCEALRVSKNLEEICYYAECHNAECRHAKCRGANQDEFYLCTLSRVAKVRTATLAVAFLQQTSPV